MAETSARELLKQLDVEHPTYTKWKDTWKRYRDVLGDDEPELEAYLPRGEYESEDVYDIRLRLTEWIPESPTPVAKLVRSIYAPPVERKLESEKLTEWTKDVDFRGTTWETFVERLAKRLLGYGTTRLLINVRNPADDAEIRVSEGGKPDRTLAEEQQAGIRPYLISYSPLSVKYWETDRFGELTMVRIREEDTIRSKDREDFDRLIRFIDYDREQSITREFRLLDDMGDKVEQVGADIVREHRLGRVPMIVENYPEEIVPMVGAGFLRYIAKADIRKIRAESDLHYDNYVHAHPLFFYEGEEEFDEVGVGASTYLKIKPGERVGYVQLPDSAAETLEREIEMNLEIMHRHAGTDPLGQMSGQQVYQASGVSRAWSFGTSEGRLLRDVATTMQRLEVRTLDLVERWTAPEKAATGRDSVFKGEINYPTEYDPSGTERLAMHRETVQEIPSETLHKVYDKRLATQFVGEVPPETREKIITGS